MRHVVVMRVKYKGPRGETYMVPLSAIHLKHRWLYEGKEERYRVEVYTDAAD